MAVRGGAVRRRLSPASRPAFPATTTCGHDTPVAGVSSPRVEACGQPPRRRPRIRHTLRHDPVAADPRAAPGWRVRPRPGGERRIHSRPDPQPHPARPTARGAAAGVRRDQYAARPARPVLGRTPVGRPGVGDQPHHRGAPVGVTGAAGRSRSSVRAAGPATADGRSSPRTPGRGGRLGPGRDRRPAGHLPGGDRARLPAVAGPVRRGKAARPSGSAGLAATGARGTAARRVTGRHGNQSLRRLLATFRPGADSAAERLLHRLLRQHGIDGWRPQYAIRLPSGRIATADVAFPASLVAIEVDGWAWHIDPERFQLDRSRQNEMVTAGWTVLRFTWTDLTERPDLVLRTVRRALATPRLMDATRC